MVRRRAVKNSEKVCDYERTSVLSFLSGVLSDSGRCAPRIDEIFGILKWLKDETSTDYNCTREGRVGAEDQTSVSHESRDAAKAGEAATLERKVAEHRDA